jgi:hypothetical protein
MKKKMLFLIIFLVSLFALPMGVLAEQDDGTCKAVDKSFVKTQASNIRVTFAPVVVEEKYKDSFGQELSGYNRYVQIKLYNVTSNMYVNVEYSGRNVSNGHMRFDYRDIGPDKSITINQLAVKDMVTYTVSVYSDYNNCYGDLIRTIRLTVPMFNTYSQSSACNGIPDYYLCKEYVTFDIDSSTFYTNIDSYRKNLEAYEGEDPDIKDNNTPVSKTATAISRYKYLIVGIIVVIGVLATIYIIKRKKSEE